MSVLLSALTNIVYSLVEPVVSRSLALGDYFVVVLAQLIAPWLLSPYVLGRSYREQLSSVVAIQRPFLRLAFLVAQVALPVGWRGLASHLIVHDTVLPSREPGRDVPVRIAAPADAVESEEPWRSQPPLLIIFMHGGGLFLGDHVGEGILYRFFASRLRATVVSVGYRMVPEHAFPACLDDCEDVARELLSSAKYRDHRVVLMGMSAGGYLAIQLSLVLAQAGVHVDGHCAIAPMVGPFAHFESVPANAWLSLFPPRAILWSWSQFLRGTRPHEWDWKVSALLATDEQLRRTSPGMLTYHTLDTLRDEGAAYAERLASVGRLHAARELPYPHGSGGGMHHILETMAQMVESRLRAVGEAEAEQTQREAASNSKLAANGNGG